MAWRPLLAVVVLIACTLSTLIVRCSGLRKGLRQTAVLKNDGDDNPLLRYAANPSIQPPFDEITTEHIVPAIRQLLKASRERLVSLEKKVQESNFIPTGETLLDAVASLDDDFSQAYSLASMLKSVKDSPPLRKAIKEVRPEVVEYSQAMSQSKPIYEAYKRLREGPLFQALREAQRRIVEKSLKGFKMGGVDLTGAKRSQFNHNAKQLSNLSQIFSEHVQDATKRWTKLVTNKDAVQGIPSMALALAAEKAVTASAAEKTVSDTQEKIGDPVNGPWLLTLDAPTVGPILSYADNRELRKEVYLAHVALASERQSMELDNEPVIRQILNLRSRQAQLLTLKDYAEMSLSKKMARNVSRVEKLLQDLHEAAHPKAEADIQDLKNFAHEHGLDGELQPWDTSYYSVKQTRALFDIDSEELRPYFPLHQVQYQGLFALVHRLFNVSLKPGSAPTWHPDVQYFDVFKDGETGPVAHLYLDLFARPGEKRSGGWMSGIRDRKVEPETGKLRLPIATINTNFRPPSKINGTDKREALMSFGEVHTFFHEMGHALQQMLTTQIDTEVAGTSGIEWDAVELPSQFMEYWLDEGPNWLVEGMAKHVGTGESLPAGKLEKLKKSMKFHAGIPTLGQIHLALMDLDLHQHPLKDGESLHEREKVIAAERKTKVMPVLDEDRKLCSFAHIFSGGYAAGYYSYKWADVLSADAFAQFEEDGQLNLATANEDKLRSTGRRFVDTVLAMGGGQDPATVFRNFRGRDPSVAALVRYTFGDDHIK